MAAAVALVYESSTKRETLLRSKNMMQKASGSPYKHLFVVRVNG